MERATAGRRIATVLAATVLGACALAAAPVVAHADEDTRVAVVQGTLPVSNRETLDSSLMTTGYVAKPAAQALSGVDALGAPDSDVLSCATALEAPESSAPSFSSAVAASSSYARNGQTADYKVGDTRRFFARDRESEGFVARVAAVGELWTIWVEEGYDLFSDAVLEQIKNELDAAIPKTYESFGTADRYDLDDDGKVAFVFRAFGVDYADGEFREEDLLTEKELEGMGSAKPGFANSMDMLHVDIDVCKNPDGSRFFDRDRVMTVLVHELQHLICYAQTGGDGEMWLNEAFSQASAGIAGYGKRFEVDMSYLSTFIYNAVGVPFVCRGSEDPAAYLDSYERAATYAQWFLFSRYLANQTRGFESDDGQLRGGDEIYKSVFACKRNVDDFGACTEERLMETLQEIGYAGKGRTVETLDELVLNYNTALLLREKTGPYSLTNDPRANPSVIDGATMPLLMVAKGAVSQAVYGGGAAVYVELGRAERVGKPGNGVQEKVVDSPLPLTYEFEASPASGSALRDGDLIALDSPQLDLVPGSYLEYSLFTQQEFAATDPDEWRYRKYEGPIAFDAERPLVIVRFVCDCGESQPAIVNYEVDVSNPGEGEEPNLKPDPGDAGAGPGDDVPPPAGGDVSPPAGVDVPDDSSDEGEAVLAPTGDPVASVALTFAALAAASVVALAVVRRRHGGVAP